MKAVILVAGQGTRLRPYTDHIPKCMVEFMGKPLLSYQLAALKGAGIDNIVLVGGYKASELNAGDARLLINHRYAETNMVATLFTAADEMDGMDDLLICYGDIIYEPRILEALKACEDPVCVSVDKEWRRMWALRMDNPLDDAETLKLSGNRVLEIGKKPTGYEDIQGQYMGLIKVRADYVTKIKSFWLDMDRAAHYDGKNFDNMYMTSLLQSFIDTDIPVTAVPVENGWLEVDSVEDLETYTKLAHEGILDSYVRLSAIV